jgi:spermidine synthase
VNEQRELQGSDLPREGRETGNTHAALRTPAKIDWRLTFGITAIGATSIATQIILLREFLSVFYGNELVIGMILANWMIITGAGSFLGKYSGNWEKKGKALLILLAAVAVFPTTTLVLLRLLRNVVFTTGSMVGTTQILYSSFILLLPYCLIAGFSFTLVAEIAWKRYDANLIRHIYALEAAGSVLGGVLLNFVLIFYLKAFQSLLIFMAFDFLAIVLLLAKNRKAGLVTAVALSSIFVVVLLFISDLDDFTAKALFDSQELLYYKETPYGTLAVTQQADQTNFYENNVLLFSTNDVASNEEAVHYGMIQHPDPKTVLLISGGISGITQEILKYNIEKIDYVEINPWIVKMGRQYNDALTDKRITIINQDARLYVKQTEKKYDVVLINVPEPNTVQLNRFYSLGFFEELAKNLTKNAVVSTSLASSADYLSSESRRMRSVLYVTLRAVFRNVVIVPGMRDYFLASDGRLDLHITQMVKEKHLATTYVNENYLDDELIGERSGSILSTIDLQSPLNTDFEPIAYYRQLEYWLSQFREDYWVFALIGVGVAILLAGRMTTITFGILTGGFAATATEIVLLISFQIIYGYVYLAIGVIITIFMAGLAIGALLSDRFTWGSSIRRFTVLQVCIGGFVLLIPAALSALKNVAGHSFLVQAAFSFLTLVIALFVGAEFAQASRLERGTVAAIASNLYSVDLVGSALGALLVTSYLIPLLGITKVCLIVAGSVFISAIVSVVRSGHYVLQT